MAGRFLRFVFYFVVSRLVANAQQLADSAASWELLLTIGVASVVYGVMLLLQAGAWGLLLSGSLGNAVRWPEVLSVYGRSQIMKYLPGNFLHVVGRQALCRNFGWPQSGVSMATILEITLLIVTTIFVIIVLGTIVSSNLFSYISKPLMLFGTVGILIATWLFLFYGASIPLVVRVTGGLDFRRLASSFHVPAAVGLYVIFFWNVWHASMVATLEYRSGGGLVSTSGCKFGFFCRMADWLCHPRGPRWTWSSGSGARSFADTLHKRTNRHNCRCRSSDDYNYRRFDLLSYFCADSQTVESGGGSYSLKGI